MAATVVDDPTEGPPVHSEDPDDDLVALAARDRAALVFGDRHLLALSARIPVYSPQEFLDALC